MKFLIDNALSPGLAEELQSAGYTATHVRTQELQSASDETIFDFAAENDYVIVSADTDFSFILSSRNTASPSVILFRGRASRIPSVQARLLINNIPDFEEEITSGCVASIRQDRVRIRSLPLFEGN